MSSKNDATATIGRILPGPQDRDAIHVAVVSVKAKSALRAGQYIGVDIENGEYVTNLAGKLIAIVDPFLAQKVKTGQYCWAVLYPRTVTSLRHHYTHPDVPELS